MPDEELIEAPVGAPMFAASPHDLGLNMNDLPPPPWTPEILGDDLFFRLAEVCGAGDRSMRQHGLSLDPRSFGRGRASRLARLESATPERRAELFAEGEVLQAIIDSMMPAPAGTPRNPDAPPLRGAKMVRRVRTF
jgi:hypothetical protein